MYTAGLPGNVIRGGSVIGGVRSPISTIAQPAARISAVSPVRVGGVSAIGGIQARSISPVSRIASPVTTAFATPVTVGPSVISTPCVAPTMVAPSANILQAPGAGLGRGSSMVMSQVVGQPFSLPGCATTAVRTSVVQPTYVQQPSFVQQSVVQPTYVQPAPVYVQQPSVVHVQQPSTIVTQVPTQTITQVVEEHVPAPTPAPAPVIEQTATYDRPGPEIRQTRHRGFKADARYQRRGCPCCPWWLWLLLGLLLLGLLSFGLFKWLKGAGASSSAGGSETTEETTTEKQCEQGFRLVDGKCIRCPAGSSWNGKNCIRKKTTQVTEETDGGEGGEGGDSGSSGSSSSSSSSSSESTSGESDNVLTSGAKAVGGAIGDAAGAGVDLAKKGAGAVGDAASAVGGAVSDAAGAGVDLAKKGVGAVGDAAGAGFDLAKKGASAVGGAVSDAAGAGFDLAKKGAGAVGDAAGAGFDLAKRGAGAVGGAVSDAAGAGVDLAKRGASAVGDVASSAFNGVKSLFSHDEAIRVRHLNMEQ